MHCSLTVITNVPMSFEIKSSIHHIGAESNTPIMFLQTINITPFYQMNLTSYGY